jgi:hypothetical protein
MKKELFKVYLGMIINNINSSETQEQLLVCFNMMENFENCFISIMPEVEVKAASATIYNTYRDRMVQLNFC